MRYARLLEPYKGYWDIQVDEDSATGGYHGYEYNCTVIGSRKEITCCRDEFEFTKVTGSLTSCSFFWCQIRKRSIVGNRSWILPIIDSS